MLVFTPAADHGSQHLMVVQARLVELGRRGSRRGRDGEPCGDQSADDAANNGDGMFGPDDFAMQISLAA